MLPPPLPLHHHLYHPHHRKTSTTTSASTIATSPRHSPTKSAPQTLPDQIRHPDPSPATQNLVVSLLLSSYPQRSGSPIIFSHREKPNPLPHRPNPTAFPPDWLPSSLRHNKLPFTTSIRERNQKEKGRGTMSLNNDEFERRRRCGSLLLLLWPVMVAVRPVVVGVVLRREKGYGD